MDIISMVKRAADEQQALLTAEEGLNLCSQRWQRARRLHRSNSRGSAWSKHA